MDNEVKKNVEAIAQDKPALIIRVESAYGVRLGVGESSSQYQLCGKRPSENGHGTEVLSMKRESLESTRADYIANHGWDPEDLCIVKVTVERLV